MKKTINKYQFQDAFKALRPDNFSYEGLELLFEYFEQLEQDTGEETELDVIAICCDFREDLVENIINDYSIDVGDCEPIDAVIDYLQDNTAYVGATSTGLVYQQF